MSDSDVDPAEVVDVVCFHAALFRLASKCDVMECLRHASLRVDGGGLVTLEAPLGDGRTVATCFITKRPTDRVRITQMEFELGQFGEFMIEIENDPMRNVTPGETIH